MHAVARRSYKSNSDSDDEELKRPRRKLRLKEQCDDDDKQEPVLTAPMKTAATTTRIRTNSNIVSHILFSVLRFAEE
jgi:hypothetical protein